MILKSSCTYPKFRNQQIYMYTSLAFNSKELEIEQILRLFSSEILSIIKIWKRWWMCRL